MPRKRVSVKTAKVSIRLPEPMLQKLESMVEAGKYNDISEVIRDALRKLLDEAEVN